MHTDNVAHIELKIKKNVVMLCRIVLKLGSVIDSAEVLSHRVDGRTIGSLVEPHDRIGLNRMTRLDNPVFRLNLYRYLIILNRIEPVTRLLQKLK